MTIRRMIAAVAIAATVGLLAACDSSEQRAEKYYQSGLEYLEKGDVDRALVEFRNVFKLNGRHREARLAYARAEMKRGNLREAYGQYLRIAEQAPQKVHLLYEHPTVTWRMIESASLGGRMTFPTYSIRQPDFFLQIPKENPPFFLPALWALHS